MLSVNEKKARKRSLHVCDVKVFNTSKKMNRTPSSCFSSTVAAAVAAAVAAEAAE